MNFAVISDLQLGKSGDPSPPYYGAMETPSPITLSWPHLFFQGCLHLCAWGLWIYYGQYLKPCDQTILCKPQHVKVSIPWISIHVRYLSCGICSRLWHNFLFEWEPNDNFATSPCLWAAYILLHLQDICLLLLIAHSAEHCEEDNSLQHAKMMSEWFKLVTKHLSFTLLTHSHMLTNGSTIEIYITNAPTSFNILNKH